MEKTKNLGIGWKLIRPLYRSKLVKSGKQEREKGELTQEELLGKRLWINRKNAPAVEVLWYQPENHKDTDVLPVYVYAHGGAWIALDASHPEVEAEMQNVANDANCVVVNVNYRLLQMNPFPYQQDEMNDTVKWLISNAEDLKIDPDRIVIGGGSAGGHLAAASAWMLHQEGIRLRAAILDFPFLDFVTDADNDLGMFNGLKDKLHDLFFPQAKLSDPVISPLRASIKQLQGHCDTYFIVGLQDPLYAQAVRYQELLESAGVKAELKAFDTNHGYYHEKKKANGETIQITDSRNRWNGYQHKIAILKNCYK